MSRRRVREEELELGDEPENFVARSRKKRRRRRQPNGPVDAGSPDLGAATESEDSTMVMVKGLAPGCTVLELKSTMEIYGSIARIRIDGREGIGYVKYRTPDHAQAAIAASENHLPGITISSPKVQVNQENDMAPQWQASTSFSTQSNLLRAELPLRRRGRGNRLVSEGRLNFDRSGSNMEYDGRQIVAYDDIL